MGEGVTPVRELDFSVGNLSLESSFVNVGAGSRSGIGLGSPFFGGMWELGVKSGKFLRATNARCFNSSILMRASVCK